MIGNNSYLKYIGYMDDCLTDFADINNFIEIRQIF